jgi:parallel beta-helix repeat protein
MLEKSGAGQRNSKLTGEWTLFADVPGGYGWKPRCSWPDDEFIGEMMKRMFAFTILMLGAYCVCAQTTPRPSGAVPLQCGGTCVTTAAGAAANIVNGNPIVPSGIAPQVAILPGGAQPSGTLATALATYGANTTIILPPSYSETVTTEVAMNAASVTLKCSTGATLTRSSGLTRPIITITANNVTITGCSINSNNVGEGSFGQTVLASGASNVTFTGNNVFNIEDNGIVGYGSNNFTLDSNTLSSNQYSSSVSGVGCYFYAQTGTPMTGLRVTNNRFNGSGCDIEDLNTGQIEGFIFTGNTGSISNNGEALLAGGDFSSTKNSPVLNGTIADNTCFLVGPSSAQEPFSCYTFAEGYGFNITGNTNYAAGQWVNDSIFEIGGLMNSTISGNTIYAGSDPGSQNYADFIGYLGGNTYANNNIYGTSRNGSAYQIYANTTKYNGGAVNANNNSFVGGNIIGTAPFGSLVIAVSIQCPVSGSSVTGTKIQGLNIAGAFLQGINVQDDTARSCPASATIDNNTFNGAHTGIEVINATANIGSNTYIGVTTNLSPSGMVTITNGTLLP